MKVVCRHDFLSYPEGTIYSKGKEWYFDHLLIKGKTLQDSPEDIGDFYSMNLSWAAGNDSGECFDMLEKSLKTGSSFECDESWCRDGCFDVDDLFLVYEEADLLVLNEYVKLALLPQKPDAPQSP